MLIKFNKKYIHKISIKKNSISFKHINFHPWSCIYIVYFLFQILVKYILKVTTQKSFISCTHTIKIIMCHERNQMSMMQLFNFSIMELLIKNYCFLYLADIIHLSYSIIDVFPLFASYNLFIYLFLQLYLSPLQFIIYIQHHISFRSFLRNHAAYFYNL